MVGIVFTSRRKSPISDKSPHTTESDALARGSEPPVGTDSVWAGQRRVWRRTGAHEPHYFALCDAVLSR